MGSVGYKRQYETEAIYDFAMLVKILPTALPESKELQELARRAKLTFIMAATTEQNDLKTGSIFRDRLQDCETCKRCRTTRPARETATSQALANTVPQPIKPKPSAITSAWRPLRSSRNTR